MIKFFKNLFGIGCKCPGTPKETVKEILTPVEKSTNFVVESAVGNVPLGNGATYIAPAKPANKKVKALSSPVQTKVKPKVKPAVTEGKAKGGNNVVKLQPKQNNKPKAPGKPKAKK